ncbi:DUF167 domain-containing protein [Mesorhizobium sp. NBSH29]|uniref:DUF167 family protein n=1 Tax=Mesorhizobium sp. NBSH29 TaxID=2654249 RepID=UPI00189678E9|nr:DUF167 family protein [Mesorhizobium sp. NBSH29]QPC85847.1 DUF167 domain-containing protein [Mesorhizobium sp. NBSH29]
MRASPVRLRSDGLDIQVRLTPRAATDTIDGLMEAADGRIYIKVRVRSVPEGGRANTALERLVSTWLGVPVRDVALASGSTSRIKTVRIAGDPAETAKRLQGLIGCLADP